MNWSRVRLLLIICLLMTDCILGAMILTQYRNENTVSHAALADAAAMLAEHGIGLDVDLVPTAVTRDAVYRVPVSEDGYRSVLSAMVGAPVSGIYLLPASTGMSVVFDNGDRAEYYHNLYLTYTKNGGNPADGDWATLASSFDEETQSDAFRVCNVRRDAAAKQAKETAEAFLARMTYASDAAVLLSPTTRAVYTTPLDTVYLVDLYEEIAHGSGRHTSAIHGTHMRVLVEGDCVWYLAGTWVPFLPDAVYDVRKLDQVNILFSELKRLEAQMPVSADGTAAEVGTSVTDTITKMEPVYYMLWDDAGQLYLRPAWYFLYVSQTAGLPGEGSRSEILCDGVTGKVVSRTAWEETGNS